MKMLSNIWDRSLQGCSRSGSIKWINLLTRSESGNRIHVALSPCKLYALYICMPVLPCLLKAFQPLTFPHFVPNNQYLVGWTLENSWRCRHWFSVWCCLVVSESVNALTVICTGIVQASFLGTASSGQHKKSVLQHLLNKVKVFFKSSFCVYLSLLCLRQHS